MTSDSELPPDHLSRRSSRTATVCFCLAGLLALWAVVLFLWSPQLSNDADGLEVSCESVFIAGFSSELFGESAETRSDTYDVVKGEDPGSSGPDVVMMSDRMDSHCDRRRTTFVAYMALLLAPASVLTSAGLSARLRS